MTTFRNQTVYLARTPEPGPLTRSVFELRDEPVPALGDGDILVRIIYISIDAGSRGQLDPENHYVVTTAQGRMPFSSGAVGEVVASHSPAWQVGDLVASINTRWQRYRKFNVHKDLFLTKLDPADGPLAIHLGVLGIVGFTAYVGMLEVARPKEGECVLVSAAAGGTGSLAGQFAKIAGARTVGIAGGEAKCTFVKRQLGFDDCIDHKQGDIQASIRQACPEGVDVYYENVGGEVQRAAFQSMNDFGRIVLCGQVSQYSGGGHGGGPNLMVAITKRLTIRGFLVFDHYEHYPRFRKQATQWLKEGKLKHHATITQGLDNIHDAINSLVSGQNVGKQLCQVSEDPTRGN